MKSNSKYINFFMSSQNKLETLSKKKQRLIASEYRELSTSIKEEISQLYEKWASDEGVLTREEMEKYGRLTRFELFLNEEVTKLTRNQNSITRQAIIESFTQSYYMHGYMMESEVLASLSYGALNPKKIEAVLYNPLDLIKWTDRNRNNNEMMKRQLKEVLMVGMVQGQGYNKMMKSLTDRINVGANKAIKIVQTETHRATSAGNLESMRHSESMGVVMKKRWVSTLDSRTRDSHKSLDGQEVGVDEQFKIRGYSADAPSHFGVASEDINCRCTMISVVDGFEPKVRRIRNADGKNEIIPYTNYREWEKNLKPE